MRRAITNAVPLMAAGLVLATTVPAAQAAPGSDTIVETRDATLADGRSDWDIAACPLPMRAVGGGVGTTGPEDPEGAPYHTLLSGPLDSLESANVEDGETVRRWLGYMANFSGAQQLFKVFALCSRTSDATVEAEEFAVPTGTNRSAIATCPAGTRVVGGGVNTTGSKPEGQGPGSTPYRVMLSGPLDETRTTAGTDTGDVARSWSAYVGNSSGAQQPFRVFALCSRSADATVAAREFTIPYDGASGASRSATVACPAGSRALGGGVGTTGPAPDGDGLPYRVLSSGPVADTDTADTRSGDVARRWRAYAYRKGGDPQLPFKVFALCARDEASVGGPPGGGGSQGGGAPSGGGSGGGGGPSGGGGPNGGGGPTGGSVPRCAGKRATIVGTARRDVLRGTRRADVIVALGGNDRVLAGRGNDLICGGAGDDTLLGERGNDRMIGAAGRDSLNGGDGNDALDGGGGRDRLLGQGGRDQCLGGADKDRATCERKRGI